MNSNSLPLKNLEIKEDRYQVFLLSSPAHFPICLWTHSWFVINKKGALQRYEVRHKRNTLHPELGHIHKDMLPFFEGIEVFSFLEAPRWKATLLGSIEGVEHSPAHAMCTTIEESFHTYPYKDHYFVFGPNSNTYVQWILNAFPNFKTPLPWSALGRNYRSKQ